MINSSDRRHPLNSCFQVTRSHGVGFHGKGRSAMAPPMLCDIMLTADTWNSCVLFMCTCVVVILFRQNRKRKRSTFKLNTHFSQSRFYICIPDTGNANVDFKLIMCKNGIRWSYLVQAFGSNRATFLLILHQSQKTPHKDCIYNPEYTLEKPAQHPVYYCGLFVS